MSYEKAISERWFHKINPDGSRSPSFRNKGQIGKQMYAEMIASGETPAEYVAPEPEPIPWDEQRRQEYIKQGVTRNDWVDLDMEGDTVNKAIHRDKIQTIKLAIPKPEA